jgi:hypothetical protein
MSGFLSRPFFFRFADEQFAGIEFLAQRVAQLRRIRLPLRETLLQQEVEIHLRVEVLARGGCRCGRLCRRGGLVLRLRGEARERGKHGKHGKHGDGHGLLLHR